MKFRTVFVCQKCGYESPKWADKCPECGEWNCLTEEVKAQETKKTAAPFGAAGEGNRFPYQRWGPEKISSAQLSVPS